MIKKKFETFLPIVTVASVHITKLTNEIGQTVRGDIEGGVSRLLFGVKTSSFFQDLANEQ